MKSDLKLIQKSVIKYNVALGEVVRVARQVAPEDKALPQQCSRHLQALVVDDGSVRYDQRYHHLHQGTLPALRKKKSTWQISPALSRKSGTTRMTSDSLQYIITTSYFLTTANSPFFKAYLFAKFKIIPSEICCWRFAFKLLVNI